MEIEKLEAKIKDLQKEYQKGQAVIEETRATMFRIEGAILKLQELVKEAKEEKQPVEV